MYVSRPRSALPCPFDELRNGRCGPVLAVQINLPVPPLLRPERGVDMLILLDNSAEIREAPSLQLVCVRCVMGSGMPCRR